MAAAEPEAVRAVESGGQHAEKTNLPLGCSADESIGTKKGPAASSHSGPVHPSWAEV